MDYPLNETYTWDQGEGIVGVLGVAPAATADFYQRLTRMVPAKKDWEHVRVLIDSNPKLPSRGRHMELGEADPSPYIRTCILALLDAGATVVAVPCNTAHILYPEYAAGMEHRVPHMVDLAVSDVASLGSVPQRLAVLGSRLTNERGLYAGRLRQLGGGVLSMAPWQGEITGIIEHVKQGGGLEAASVRLRAVISECESAGADALVVACSEISAIPKIQTQIPIVDSSESLARFCIEKATGRAVSR